LKLFEDLSNFNENDLKGINPSRPLSRILEGHFCALQRAFLEVPSQRDIYHKLYENYFSPHYSLFCIKTLKFQRKMSGKYNSSTNLIFAILGAFLCKFWGYLHLNLKLSAYFVIILVNFLNFIPFEYWG